jgi:hypothetical protein
MLSLIPLALAATLGVSATPTPPASNPISVALCEVIPADSISLDAPTPRGIGAIDISFMNHAAVAAKDVTFVIRYAGATQTIDDRGTFSQNVSIVHGFMADVDGYGNGAACSVAAVTFADGTSWHA